MNFSNFCYAVQKARDPRKKREEIIPSPFSRDFRPMDPFYFSEVNLINYHWDIKNLFWKLDIFGIFQILLFEDF